MDQRKPSRPARAARLSPTERRAQLLQCAVKAFADVGISRAGHADVARRAAVSAPTVFAYFPTREVLVAAVIDEVARFIVDDVVAPVQRLPLPVPEILIETGLAFTEAVGSHPDHARVWLDWSTAFRADVWPGYVAFQARVGGLLKATIMRGRRDGSLARGLDADDATALIVGSAHMLAQMKYSGRAPAQIAHFMRTLIDGFRAGTHPTAPASRGRSSAPQARRKS